MGLDIYGNLVVKARSSKEEPLKSILEYEAILTDRAKSRFHEFAVKSLKKLEKALSKGSDEYSEVYGKVFKEMPKFTKYGFKYQKMLDEVKSMDEVKEFFDSFEEHYYAESDVYFRKVNFVYNFFSNKLEDECCFADKSDIEELISRCDKVLADHSLAQELLPTRSGFFFGSTDYDDWYFNDVKDCRKQMKSLLRKYNEDTDVMYFIMSW